MKIVIDIPHDAIIEDEYVIFNANKYSMSDIIKWIENGKVLPKYHGNLIDASSLFPRCSYNGDCWSAKCDKCSNYVVSKEEIDNAEVIISRSEE